MAKNFVQRDNVETLNLIRNFATVDYQRRIPDVDKANVQDVMHNLFQFRPALNEFVDGLVNRIGREFVVFRAWQNKLAIFKDEAMLYGDTIEEVGVGLTQANRYDPSRNYLEGAIFGQHRPDTRTAFHKINRMDRYDITINEAMLRRAFVNPSGLSNFVAAQMESPITSDQWDEYLMMTRLFKEMYDIGAFWKVNVPDVSNVASDAPDAKYLVRQLRSWTEQLSFISGHYNLAKLETHTKPSDIVVFVTPESKAAIDVEALAAAFNLSYMDLESRTITVRAQDIGIPGFQAAIVDEGFFKAADTLLQTTTADNPVGLYQNFFLHHHGIYSASPMSNAILFTSAEASDVIELDPTPVASVDLEVQDLDGNVVTSVTRGLFYRLVGAAVTTPEGGYNDAVRLEIEPGTSSTHTYLRQSGEFSIGLDEEASSVVVTGYATDTPIPQVKAQVTVTVIGPRAVFPPPAVDEDGDGLIEVTPTAPKFVDGKDGSGVITIPTKKGVAYKNGATTVQAGDISVTAATTITATATAGYELATGATASWTFTPTGA